MSDVGLGLVKYDAMILAIEACHSVDEVKEIRDKARAIEVYAAQALNRDAERQAAEIRIRAERKTGELLRQTKKNGERAAPAGNLKRGPKSAETTSETTLADLGISKDQSSQPATSRPFWRPTKVTIPNEYACPDLSCLAMIGEPCTEVDTSGERHPMQGFHAERVMLTHQPKENG
jgi:hypothetical protein